MIRASPKRPPSPCPSQSVSQPVFYPFSNPIPLPSSLSLSLSSLRMLVVAAGLFLLFSAGPADVHKIFLFSLKQGGPLRSSSLGLLDQNNWKAGYYYGFFCASGGPLIADGSGNPSVFFSPPHLKSIYNLPRTAVFRSSSLLHQSFFPRARGTRGRPLF